ncbi:DUF488 domain-containing protein [Arenibaculum pallidiluteum]|uniref:DUF488 domain-containing protein n=1 Tax=Arenibaculum pallidiluteum TaxID=2812559 RepID=UPI001A9577E8|nr:DUF488 domain-containing protein [Arenibaculum pallidiluteum]
MSESPGAVGAQSGPVVFTIGYEASGFDRFLATLREAGVAVVVDVRDLPLSRRAGFSKGTLRASLAAAGIDYVHLKPLGTPKEGRLANRRRDWETFWRIVEERMQEPAAEFALREAAEIAAVRPAALLCFEADPCICHRRRVAEALRDRFGFRVEHLRV